MPPDITLFDEGTVFVNVVRVEDENGQIVTRVRAGLGGTLRVLRVPEPSTVVLPGAGLLGLVRRKSR